MEKLINDILSLGGQKSRLEIKLFGGSNVIQSSALIGDRNCEFVRNFLKMEGLVCAGEDMGGAHPRRIHYYPYSGKVMMRTLHRKEDYAIVETEKKYARKLASAPLEGGIDLF